MTDDEVDEIVGIVDAYLADVCARLTGAPGFVAGQRTPSRLKTGRRNMKRRRWPGEREFRSEISANF
jgi:hypothetical protein